ncbi:segregation/condensation protein A [Candidatus Micrarchaeota archaeon]|nr:segregation/condensation protein A [Candidatus Micrarchaeota archaeon]MBU1929963.1 segregation/condensation protein A [Candidatus Micrarchaeota archaeon]
MPRPFSSPKSKSVADSEQALPDLKTVELPETVSHEYLVDLIDQPAWKTILLTIVKQEKMDPWDIDIILLADKYLEKIGALEQANLRVPANAMLASAILLKTKSKSLRITTLDDLEKAEAKRELSPEERALLERGIPELRSMRGIREGKVTLDELVNTIEVMLNKSSAKTSLSKKFEEIRFTLPFAEMNIETKMKDVLALVHEKMDSQGMVLFSQLANGKQGANEILNIFIPLLFLANNNKLSVWQEEFWEEIFVKLNSMREEGE